MTILRDWPLSDIEIMREMRAGGAIWRAIGLRFGVTHKVIIRLSQRYGFYDGGEATHAASQPKLKKGMRSNRAWSDEVEAEIERLVTGTLLCPRDIAIKTSAKFSLSITGRQIENWARRKGLIRDKLLAVRRDPIAIQQRALDRRWHRWAYERPADNAVRRVAPGTHPARGYSMIGGRL